MPVMKNIRIGTKVVSVVILLAIIALAALGYPVYRMSDIVPNYSRLVPGTAKESLAVARANRFVQTTRADLFTIIEETDTAELQKLTTVLDTDAAKFHEFIDAAKAARPEEASKFDPIAGEYDRLFAYMK